MDVRPVITDEQAGLPKYGMHMSRMTLWGFDGSTYVRTVKIASKLHPRHALSRGSGDVIAPRATARYGLPLTRVKVPGAHLPTVGCNDGALSFRRESGGQSMNTVRWPADLADACAVACVGTLFVAAMLEAPVRAEPVAAASPAVASRLALAPFALPDISSSSASRLVHGGR